MIENATVAIIGLGLMGGSLALALQARGSHFQIVIGIDRDAATIQRAMANGAVQFGYTEIDPVLHNADVVVFATPVRTILRLLPAVGVLARPGALILDLGSTKSEIVDAMDRLPPSLCAVGGHPMCGKETSGFDSADAGLYQDKLFILTPTARSSEGSLALAAVLARAAGARVQVMDAARHDALVAAVSHLPFLLAAGLVNRATEWADRDRELWNVAASGFRDTTRLAGSDTEMMLDILLTNRQAIAARLGDYTHELDMLAERLEKEDQVGLREWLEMAAAARRSLDRGLGRV